MMPDAPWQCWHSDGGSLLDTSELYYYGNSTGGIQGSIVTAVSPDIQRAVRIRRMFGGAMRQSGILAAAGLYALDHNLGRLPD